MAERCEISTPVQPLVPMGSCGSKQLSESMPLAAYDSVMAVKHVGDKEHATDINGAHLWAAAPYHLCATELREGRVSWRLDACCFSNSGQTQHGDCQNICVFSCAQDAQSRPQVTILI